MRKLTYENINDQVLNVKSGGKTIATQTVENPSQIKDIMALIRSEGAQTFATDKVLESAGFTIITETIVEAPKPI